VCHACDGGREPVSEDIANRHTMSPVVPVIDIKAADAAHHIDRACRSAGFFAVANHGVPDTWRTDLISSASEFFALPESVKQRSAMMHGGAAWRGWFPLCGELTAGVPDLKEGYYFGREDSPDDPRALHGRNVWPTAESSELRVHVERWMDAMERLGQRLLALMGDGLGCGPRLFVDGLTAQPTPLFRIFRYPPHPPDSDDRWGVAEHTDYGLLTLLAHDGTPGLEVRSGGAWLAAPHDPQLIVCNIGDMLDRLTQGRYRSTAHRVRNSASTADRYSLPFFLDPGWDAVVQPIALADDGWVAPEDAAQRWDRASLRAVGGTYGEWITRKVSKVFPDLASRNLGSPQTS
jgi:isopenicillin N synthase-like dioxygenase